MVKLVSARVVVLSLVVLIVAGGFAVALISSSSGLFGNFSSSPGVVGPGPNSALAAQGGDRIIPGYTQVVSTRTASLSTGTGYPTTSVIKGTTAASGAPPRAPANRTLTGGSFIEFSSGVTMESPTPAQTASGVVALAYSAGGYVAYQSTYRDAAYVVIRVPAASYQTVVAQIQTMGNVTSLVSNSNDVTVQYTDLNATLASLRTEQVALLRLLNQSSTINSTLAIESQLQGVNQQINFVQSQILQTQRLIAYSTVDVTIAKSVAKKALSMTLVVTPRNGTAPLSVTMNALVKGGTGQYLVNFNFGDGSSDQGQILVHTYYGQGDYKVFVTVTDQDGAVVSASATVRVEAPPGPGLGDFPGRVLALFVGVVEGIVEVAVVVLPLAALGAVIIIPLRRRSRAQKELRPAK